MNTPLRELVADALVAAQGLVNYGGRETSFRVSDLIESEQSRYFKMADHVIEALKGAGLLAVTA